eukprot:TRINITY_DN11859_c1_g1_i2.p1 TRINITY_DN11859_c1_g1~~TRINITY_DN11859_c1_g1_i2.p1  ORF type:complete len:379 (+),score=99.31 TRINITY_DN11859_c1_g1_i2:2-1138(+)
MEEEGGSSASPSPRSKPSWRSREAEREPEPEPEPMETEEEKEKRENKVKAMEEKNLGNEAYKKRDFDTAIAHYSKAIELDDEEIAYLTNRAAAHFEAGNYEKCIKDCDAAVERGREIRADYKVLAKALTRKGNALVKLAKTAADYVPAIQVYQKALTEHRNPDTLKKLNDAERTMKEKQQEEYYDPELAEVEREKGNEYFKKSEFPDAIKHYTEALKRNPNDHRVYSNRAACYTKLGAFPEGLKDAEKCIELDPTFVKGYSRKGTVQFFMKEYDKALETYQTGLKYSENNQEMLDGIKRCVDKINQTNRGEVTPEEMKERQAKAMSDPEIQQILTDPVMRQVLQDFQENPSAAQQHTRNPMVMQKIQKLVAAGIVQVR